MRACDRLRQWVLTFPFPWRRRLAQDCALFGKLTAVSSAAPAVVKWWRRHSSSGVMGSDCASPTRSRAWAAGAVAVAPPCPYVEWGGRH